jgi:hypothetical protein
LAAKILIIIELYKSFDDFSVVCGDFIRSFVKNSVQSRGLVIAILFVTWIFAENYKSNNNKSPASIIACRTLLFNFSLFTVL